MLNIIKKQPFFYSSPEKFSNYGKYLKFLEFMDVSKKYNIEFYWDNRKEEYVYAYGRNSNATFGKKYGISSCGEIGSVFHGGMSRRDLIMLETKHDTLVCPQLIENKFIIWEDNDKFFLGLLTDKNIVETMELFVDDYIVCPKIGELYSYGKFDRLDIFLNAVGFYIDDQCETKWYKTIIKSIVDHPKFSNNRIAKNEYSITFDWENYQYIVTIFKNNTIYTKEISRYNIWCGIDKAIINFFHEISKPIEVYTEPEKNNTINHLPNFYEDKENARKSSSQLSTYRDNGEYYLIFQKENTLMKYKLDYVHHELHETTSYDYDQRKNIHETIDIIGCYIKCEKLRKYLKKGSDIFYPEILEMDIKHITKSAIPVSITNNSNYVEMVNSSDYPLLDKVFDELIINRVHFGISWHKGKYYFITDNQKGKEIIDKHGFDCLDYHNYDAENMIYCSDLPEILLYRELLRTSNKTNKPYLIQRSFRGSFRLGLMKEGVFKCFKFSFDMKAKNFVFSFGKFYLIEAAVDQVIKH